MNAKYYPEKHQPIYGRHLGIGDATVKDSTYRRGPFATARVGALAAAAGITVLLSASLALTSCASGVGEPAESSSAAVQTTSMTSAPVSDPTGRIAGADSSANASAADVAPANTPASDTSNAAAPPTASNPGAASAEEAPAGDAEAAEEDYGESDAGFADEAVPVGDYSFVAPRGGYRGGINVAGDGTATMTNASAMSPDVETTVYSLEPTGETSPSGTAMISMVPIDGPGTTTLSLYYDSAQDALIVDGTAFVRV